mmetsp:Transcript_45985/g.132611  ORF Transcript_45985/g.132611 Transcript_45985/m.132611 type:complete len:430 (+) Transcript_45985:53-1342(+)
MDKADAQHRADEFFREREGALLQWHTGVYIRGVLPCTAFYFALALQPFVDGLDHFRVPMLLFGSLSLICVLVRYIASRTADADIKCRLQHAETVCLIARLVMHGVCVAYDGDSSHVFLKLISLWFLPLSAAKESMTVDSFKIYLVFHNLLVLQRFWHNMGECAAWVFGTLVVDRMLLDLSHARHEGDRMREELARANIEIEQLAEETTKRLFQRFCDATATLNAEMQITEPAPQLAAMLGISEANMKGRSFMSLIDGEDMDNFRGHVDALKSAHSEAPAPSWEEESGSIRPRAVDHHPESIQVKLLDAFAKPVPVHVFHASFHGLDNKRVYFIGLSETWRPPRSSKAKKDANKRVGSGTTPTGGVCGSLLSEPALGSDPASTLLMPGGRQEHAGLAHRRGNSPRPGALRPAMRQELAGSTEGFKMPLGE